MPLIQAQLQRLIVSRRSLLIGGALAAAGCKGGAEPARAAGPSPALKSIAPFPVGACAMTGELEDPEFRRLLLTHFSQITPEWEMKMEYILQPDGSYRWDAPDRLAAFAREHELRLLGHTLIWHQEQPAAFERLDGAGAPFADAYRDYIHTVADRYRGRVAGWDVVNEAVAEDGSGLRDCLWSRNLGAEDYIVRAFEHAREADPNAVLILNDYNLESLPRKRATFLRLVERLLKRGTPLGGLGTQTHIDIGLQPGAISTAIREMAQFGLPIHISELDVSTKGGRFDLRSPEEKLQLQARLFGEGAEAFMALPARQRFAFTVWGVRDRDSWLTRSPNGDSRDQPVLFDNAGRPKPSFWAVADRLRRRLGNQSASL